MGELLLFYHILTPRWGYGGRGRGRGRDERNANKCFFSSACSSTSSNITLAAAKETVPPPQPPEPPEPHPPLKVLSRRGGAGRAGPVPGSTGGVGPGLVLEQGRMLFLAIPGPALIFEPQGPSQASRRTLHWTHHWLAPAR